MATLTDEQKVMRNDTGQNIAEQIRLLRLQMEGGGLPAGGAVGQIPVKASAADYVTEWQYPQYCRPNLLDNWYFVGGGSQLGDGVFPINQRGQQNYSGNVYGADRWRGDNSSSMVTLQEDGLLLGQVSGASNYGRLRQELDFHAGISSVVTFSAILKNSNGGFLSIYNLTTGSAVKIADSAAASGVSNGELLSVSATIPANTTKLLVRIQSGSVQSDSCVIVAAKLELGYYQTLAHNEGTDESPNWVLNELPDYGQELAKCRRKYVKINKIPLSGFIHSTGRVCYVDTGFEMDGTVALTVSALGTLMTTAGTKTLSDVIVQTSMSPHICLRFLIETPDSTVGSRPACVADPVIELSTE